MRMSSLSSSWIVFSANFLMDAREDRSNCLTMTSSLDVDLMISSAAACALLTVRQARITLAPVLKDVTKTKIGSGWHDLQQLECSLFDKRGPEFKSVMGSNLIRYVD